MSRGATRRDSGRGEGQKRTSSGSDSGAAKQGAIQAKTSWSQRQRSYWMHHRVSLVGSFQRLLATPMQTLMTSLVVAIALALPSGLLATLGNLQQLGEAWDTSPKISVYLKKGAQPAAIDSLLERTRSLAGVAQVSLVTAEQALVEFEALSGFGEALEALEDNPLPDTLIVTPLATHVSPDKLQLLQRQMDQPALVDEVSLDLAWVKKLSEIMRLGQRIVIGLAVLLGLGVLLAIGNTIRLSIENRRDEIIVIKLVGGTNGFVSRPFLYIGVWYGLFGGLLAWLIVTLGFALLQGPVSRLALLYQSDFYFSALGSSATLGLFALSTGLGWLGARLAVSRHLSSIEPR